VGLSFSLSFLLSLMHPPPFLLLPPSFLSLFIPGNLHSTSPKSVRVSLSSSLGSLSLSSFSPSFLSLLSLSIFFHPLLPPSQLRKNNFRPSCVQRVRWETPSFLGVFPTYLHGIPWCLNAVASLVCEILSFHNSQCQHSKFRARLTT
jgi:hypothetical protein